MGDVCVVEWMDFTAILRPAVYLLRARGVVVYVGKSKCPLARIYTHRSFAGRRVPSWIKVRGIPFDSVAILPTRIENLDEVERHWIAHYKPRYNIHHLPKIPLSVIMKLPPSAPFERRI